MSYVKLPPAPIRQEYGTYAWIDWWNKVRDYSQNTFYVADSAFTGLSSKLNRDAADVLGGTITFNSLGAFKVGSVTWNGTSATGTGVMFTENGIVGANGGSIKFVIKSDGTATFGGQLTAASGTFSGDIIAGGSIYCSGLTNQFVTFTQEGSPQRLDPSILATVNTNTISGGNTYYGTGLVGQATNTNGIGVVGVTSSIGRFGLYGFCENTANTSAGVVGYGTGNAIGVAGNSQTGYAVYGYATQSGTGVFAGSYTGTALYVAGPMQITSTVKVVNLNADMLDSRHAGNTAGDIPINNGTVCTSLNADQVDGYHAGNSNGNVPVSNGTINTNLFAEFSSKLQATGNTFQFKNGRSTGSQTPTAIPNNKPGTTSGSVAWLTINIDGTDYYVPSWTA